jgi:hypothetical protein
LTDRFNNDNRISTGILPWTSSARIVVIVLAKPVTSTYTVSCPSIRLKPTSSGRQIKSEC